MPIRPRLGTAAAAFALAALPVFAATPAQAANTLALDSAAAPSRAAADTEPCGPPYQHPTDAMQVQNCPDWSPDGKIPVHRSPDPASEIVGHIDAAGDDWYFCQKQGAPFKLGEHSNSWWANTKADNGRWGMVSEVYFKGGGNNEPDGALKQC